MNEHDPDDGVVHRLNFHHHIWIHGFGDLGLPERLSARPGQKRRCRYNHRTILEAARNEFGVRDVSDILYCVTCNHSGKGHFYNRGLNFFELTPLNLLDFRTIGRRGVTFIRTGSKGAPAIREKPALYCCCMLSSGRPSNTKWIGVLSGIIQRMTSFNSFPNWSNFTLKALR